VDRVLFGLLGLLRPVAMPFLMLFIVLKAGAGGREFWSEGSTGFSSEMLDDATVFWTGEEFLANSINLWCLPRTRSTASSCSSTNLCIARSGSAVGRTLTFFRSICSFSMLKGAFVELDPDMDCIGRVTAFEYVILEGQIKAMETRAALLTGARDGLPMTVTGVGVGCSTTSSTREVEGLASVYWNSCIRLSTVTGTNALLTVLWAALALQAFSRLPPFLVHLTLNSP
jgi:hypothetical protein